MKAKYRNGVMIRHGNHKQFLDKEILEKSCAVVCSKCGGMIELTTFGSAVGRQLIDACKCVPEREIEVWLAEKK